MSIQIFWGSGSPYSWRVLLALELKRIPYTSTLVSFAKREHKTPQFLAMNPRGKVPVLKEGAYVLYESLAILAYLERKVSEPALFGTHPEQTGLIWRHVCEYTAYVDDAVEKFILPLYAGNIAGKHESIGLALATVTSELAKLDTLLAASPYVVGDSVSAADLVWYPVLKSIERAASKPVAADFHHGLLPIAERFPHLDAWARRIEVLPGYERTYPPHWR